MGTFHGLIFNCEWCGEPIEKAAALLFSAPVNDMARKHNMCAKCYDLIVRMRMIESDIDTVA